MSTFTAVKSGPMSDPATFSGSPSTPPASGDTVLVQGFTVVADYSIGSSGIALNDTSTTDGYIVVSPGRTLKLSGLTGGINITGASSNLEFDSSGSYHV